MRKKIKAILQIEGFLFLQDPEVTRGCQVGGRESENKDSLQF